MGTTYNKTTLISGYNLENIEVNFTDIETALGRSLSRFGDTPNEMQSDFDLNSNSLLNAQNVNTQNLFVQGVKFVPNNSIAVPNWEGAWLTTTDYVVNDLVRESGTTYICLVAHTSGTFSTDLSMNYWEIFASAGGAGAGTGDLLAANDLSDLNDADTALSNLGGGAAGISVFKDTTVGNIKTTLSLGDAADANKTGIDSDVVSGTAGTDGNLAQWNSDGDLVDGPDVLNEDDLASDSDTAVPTQGSVKAYVDTSISNSGAEFTFTSVADLSSGTGTTFSALPAGITEFHILFDQVSTTTSDIKVRIGTSSGIENTGYFGSSNGVSSTNSYMIDLTQGSSIITGVMSFYKYGNTNKWITNHAFSEISGAGNPVGGGSKTLSGTLDRVELLLNSGSFDAGEVILRYK